MLALTDQQLTLVTEAAGLFSPPRRDLFLRSVAARLADIQNPSDAQVETAVHFVLNTYGISTPRLRAS
jgi:hypothetical protein